MGFFYRIVDGIGAEGYDAGAKTLEEFYAHDLGPLGKSVIDLCLNGGDVDAYRSRLALYPRGTKNRHISLMQLEKYPRIRHIPK